MYTYPPSYAHESVVYFLGAQVTSYLPFAGLDDVTWLENCSDTHSMFV